MKLGCGDTLHEQNVNYRMAIVLGLDVSTSITGIAVMDSTNPDAILYVGHCDTSKVTGLSSKARMLQDALEVLPFRIDEVAIEEPMLAFAGGKSSASVISTLAQMNGMAQLLVRQIFGCEPTLWNVNTARKKALPEMKFSKGVKRKETVQQFVHQKYPSLEVPLKRTGAIKDHVFDESDAIVISLAHSKSLK